MLSIEDQMALSQPDRVWITEEIAKNSQDLEDSLSALKIQVARIEGQLSGPTVPTRPPHPWVTPVIAVLGTVFAGFLGWMAFTIMQHGNTLAKIQQALLGLNVAIAANNPTAPQAQADAVAVLAASKRDSIPIPAQAIERAGNSFVDAARTDPQAWNVALDFIAYRTSLNERPNFPIVSPPDQWKTNYTTRDPIGKPRPIVKWGLPIVDASHAAKYDPIGIDENENVPKQPAWLILSGGATGLDGMQLRNVVFQGVQIHYLGLLPMSLQNVVFINCTFVFDPNEATRKFGERLLASSTVNFSS
jgi:hypothetical protein